MSRQNRPQKCPRNPPQKRQPGGHLSDPQIGRQPKCQQRSRRKNQHRIPRNRRLYLSQITAPFYIATHTKIYSGCYARTTFATLMISRKLKTAEIIGIQAESVIQSGRYTILKSAKQIRRLRPRRSRRRPSLQITQHCRQHCRQHTTAIVAK